MTSENKFEKQPSVDRASRVDQPKTLIGDDDIQLLLLLMSNGKEHNGTSTTSPGSVLQTHVESPTTEIPPNSTTNNTGPETQDVEPIEKAFTEKKQTGGSVWRGPDTRKRKGSTDDILAIYLNDIGKVPLLTVDDERKLGKLVQDGVALKERIAEGYTPSASDRRALRRYDTAKDQFVRANLRLVVSIARRYPLPQGVDLLDLIQEGNMGMAHAVDKFDYTKGFKFSTYATFWIRQAIGRALDQKASLIRIPGDKSASLRAALREARGDSSGLTSAKEQELYRLTTPVSLDKTVGDDGDATLGDLMDSGHPTPEDIIVANADADLIDELLNSLDSRARYAVSLRFGLETGERASFREVGEHLGVTAEAARRLVYRAVSGLRDNAEKLFEDSE